MRPAPDTTLDFHNRGGGAAPAETTYALTILAHPDALRVGEATTLSQRDAELGIHRALPTFTGKSGARPLDTPYTSRQPVHLSLGPAAVEVVAGGDRPVQVDGVSAFRHVVPLANLDAGFTLRLSQEVVLLVRRGAACAPAVELTPTARLLGSSPGLVAAREAILRVAPSDAPVLLRGETGTGKELAAEAIHRASARAGGPFVAVNLAAIPASTAASQLFGHARGAFTGASAPSAGLFGAADGGTLFLDEIGEAPVELQAMLLRAIDTGEVQPVGGGGRRVDVRIVAATDACLERLIEADRFRAALFHRLAASTIALPPLRERREDIAFLLIRFLQDALGPGAVALLGHPASASSPPWLGAEVVLAAMAYPWPGNIRELAATARWMAMHCAHLPRACLPPWVKPVTARTEAGEPPAPARATPSEREQVLAALEAHSFRVEPAAKALGISRNTLRARMAKLGLRRAIDLTDAELAAAAAAPDLAAAAAELGVGEHALRVRLGETRTAPG